MSLIDPNEPPARQIERQARIIDALVRRASRQNEVGISAYSAFQSAIELQEQVAAKTRDLEKAATELESVRFDRERTRRNLDVALSAMDGGFALFTDGLLNVSNKLFQTLFPDISDRIQPRLSLSNYFALLEASASLESTDRDLQQAVRHMVGGSGGASVLSVVLELRADRWFQLNMQRISPFSVVLLLTEITAIVRQSRREREDLIDEQADYLQAAFENMTSGICTFSADGAVMMYNGPFRELLGLPFTVIQKGVRFETLLHYLRSHGLIAHDLPKPLTVLRERLRSDNAVRTRVRQGGGRVLDLQANLLPDGGFLIELKDVTLESRATEMLENRVMERTAELTRANARLTEQYEEQARVEEELRLAKERAEAAVSSKTRFLAAASHDLLQPVNAAKLMLDTLNERAASSAFAPTVKRLHRAFASTEQLLHSLLDISRLDGADPDMVTPTDVSLGVLIKGVFEDQMALADNKGVRLDAVPCSAFVRSDPVYLWRSVQNLVVNAIQYTRPGGRVLLGCRRQGNKVLLQVWDNGVGIFPQDQERIFEEFARADNVAPGSGVGLGLSVVERACRHLGHKLWLRSEPGVGSLFCIEMQQVDGTEVIDESKGLTQPDDDAPMSAIAVVIENDEDVLFATTQRLQQWGTAVLGASSTEAALAHVRDMGIAPDIILADYQLDGDDTGVRAIEAIRDLTGTRVPAIVITANRSETLRRAGEDVGFTVMTKPVQVSRLRPLIEWKIRWQSPQAQVDAPTKVGNDSGGAGSSLANGRIR